MPENARRSCEAPTAAGADGESSARRPRRAPERDISKDPEMLRKAVVLETTPKGFEVDGTPRFRSRSEIAAEMNISVEAVNALLKEARRQGMMVVRPNFPAWMTEACRLEAALRQKYAPAGLREAMVAGGLETMREDLPVWRHANHEVVMDSVVGRVVSYLHKLVAEAAKEQQKAGKAGREPKPFRVGVGRGRNLRLLTSYLRSSPREVPRLAMEVLPIIGFEPVNGTERNQAHSIATDVAEAFGVLSVPLPCPAVASQPVIARLTESPHVQNVLTKIQACDVILAEVEPILDGGEDAAEFGLDPEFAKAARAKRAVGIINYACFDRNGQTVWMPERPTGLGLARQKDSVRDPRRKVILVNGGDVRCREALRSALLDGFASCVATDRLTARWLLGEL